MPLPAHLSPHEASKYTAKLIEAHEQQLNHIDSTFSQLLDYSSANRLRARREVICQEELAKSFSKGLVGEGLQEHTLSSRMQIIRNLREKVEITQGQQENFQVIDEEEVNKESEGNESQLAPITFSYNMLDRNHFEGDDSRVENAQSHQQHQSANNTSQYKEFEVTLYKDFEIISPRGMADAKVRRSGAMLPQSTPSPEIRKEQHNLGSLMMHNYFDFSCFEEH